MQFTEVQYLAERFVVDNLLVQLKLFVDHLLKLVRCYAVERQPGVTFIVHLNTLAHGVAILHVLLKLLNKHPVILVKVVVEPLVDQFQDFRKGFFLGDQCTRTADGFLGRGQRLVSLLRVHVPRERLPDGQLVDINVLQQIARDV